MVKLCHTEIVTCPTSLSLVSKEVFQWILTQNTTKKNEFLSLNFWERKKCAQQSNKRYDYNNKFDLLHNKHKKNNIPVIHKPSLVSGLSNILCFWLLVNPLLDSTLSSQCCRYGRNTSSFLCNKVVTQKHVVYIF